MDFDHSTRLKDIAVDAANAFLTRGDSLNSKIAQLASDNDLTAEQTTRVCEFANHAVWQSMRKSASTVEFPIAEPEKVRASLGHSPKVAMIHHIGKAVKVARLMKGEDGYAEELALQKTAGYYKSDDQPRSVFKRLEAEKSAGLDTNNGKQDEFQILEAKQNAAIAYDRAKVAREEAEDVLQGKCLRFMDGLERFTCWAKEAAMDGFDLDDFLQKVAQDARIASHPEMLWKVAYCIKAAGLLADRPVTLSDKTMAALEPAALAKTAQDVEQEYVQAGLHMAGMPVQMINGRHQGVRELDTLSNEWGEIEGWRRTLELARKDEISCKGQMLNGVSLEASRAGGSV